MVELGADLNDRKRPKSDIEVALRRARFRLKDRECVMAQECLLEKLDTHTREVRQGSDGVLYVLATKLLIAVLRE